MSPNNGQNGQQVAPTTWTEPPWCGWIETTGDALLILEAARRGLIPRVTRRLVDSERKMISSGSVFVFDEDESGIKRWTDGFFWSPSRILGNFLLYRETDKKTSGRGRGASSAGGGENSLDDEGNTLSRPRDGNHISSDRARERNLMGSLTNNPKFKTDGLMKKTFSLSIGGVAQHLISYYRVEDVENGRLRSPSSLPELASLSISPEYLDKTHFRNPPKVEVGPDGVPRYRGEADDVETGLGNGRSPNPPPLASGPPLLSEGVVRDTRGANANTGKRRFEPYTPAGPSSSKRSRKRSSFSEEDQTPSPVVAPPVQAAPIPVTSEPATQVAAPVAPATTTPPTPHAPSTPLPSQPQSYPDSQSQSHTPPAPPNLSQVQPWYTYYSPHMYAYHHPSATAAPAQAASSPSPGTPSASAPSPSAANPTPAPAYPSGASGPPAVPYPYDPNSTAQQQQQVYYPYGYGYTAWPASYGYSAQQSTTAASGTEKPVASGDGATANPT
ncbi:Global transcription regulator sge1 [Marasmius crinis-equi]|uniref:Global transcription regulator sge1 n=1 Tax=Marasmius crinis-equi TaxID=585013 RepID=A0ABR3FF77_9AGAR